MNSHQRKALHIENKFKLLLNEIKEQDAELEEAIELSGVDMDEVLRMEEEASKEAAAPKSNGFESFNPWALRA